MDWLAMIVDIEVEVEEEVEMMIKRKWSRIDRMYDELSLRVGELGDYSPQLCPQCRVLIAESVPIVPIMVPLQFKLLALVFEFISLPLRDVRPHLHSVPLLRPLLDLLLKNHGFAVV